MKLSIILLDWSVREYFQALHFLQKQSVPRDQYELIWVELYDYKTVPEIVEKTADQLICCRQKGVYEKHKGYNAGLLAAKGELVCICDSDAVFPFDFVEKILHYFYGSDLQSVPAQKILQIYERRCTQSGYPGTDKIDLNTIEKDYFWQTWENVCACGVFRKKDMISFGGLDEHHSFRGFFCGYNELVNRLVNAGWEEYWMPDDQLAIWHFKHLRPVDTSYGAALSSMMKEFSADEIDDLSVLSVEAAASGRIQPLKENKHIRALRLAQRKFGSAYEEKYTDPAIYRKGAYKRFTFGWCSKMRCFFNLLRYAKCCIISSLIGSRNYEKLKQKILRRTPCFKPPCGMILAGGMGTRLQSVVADRQKVAAQVDGEPFICKILQQLRSCGITQVILCVGHKAETVEEALQGKFADMEIIYSREKEPLGTAGAIRQALDRTNAQEVLILNGDSYFDADLEDFLRQWRTSESPMGLLLKEMEDVSRYGKVTLTDDNRISAFEEKGSYSGRGLINAGIYGAVRKYLLNTLKMEKGSLEKEYFTMMAEQHDLTGVIQNGRFIDIGTPESFTLAQEFFREKI